MSDRDNLLGTWIAASDPTAIAAGQLVLVRASPQSTRWGQQFVFAADHTYEDIYATRCGNDPNYHHWRGAWQLNAATRILSIAVVQPETAPLQLRYPHRPAASSHESRQYQIVRLTPDELVLTVLL